MSDDRNTVWLRPGEFGAADIRRGTDLVTRHRLTHCYYFLGEAPTITLADRVLTIRRDCRYTVAATTLRLSLAASNGPACLDIKMLDDTTIDNPWGSMI
jgi:hypothetical protein